VNRVGGEAAPTGGVRSRTRRSHHRAGIRGCNDGASRFAAGSGCGKSPFCVAARTGRSMSARTPRASLRIVRAVSRRLSAGVRALCPSDGEPVVRDGCGYLIIAPDCTMRRVRTEPAGEAASEDTHAQLSRKRRSVVCYPLDSCCIQRSTASARSRTA